MSTTVLERPAETLSDVETICRQVEEAADLIERTGWTQRAFARNVDGDPVLVTADKAVAWCAHGGIQRTAGYNSEAAAAVKRYLGGSISAVNDAPGMSAEAMAMKLREFVSFMREEYA